MSNTVNVDVLKSDGWKLGITGPSTGTFSGGSSYEFCNSDTQPVEGFVGHRVSNSDLVFFDVTSGASVYFKSTRATIVITEG